jgi:hypothetical protein
MEGGKAEEIQWVIAIKLTLLVIQLLLLVIPIYQLTVRLLFFQELLIQWLLLFIKVEELVLNKQIIPQGVKLKRLIEEEEKRRRPWHNKYKMTLESFSTLRRKKIIVNQRDRLRCTNLKILLLYQNGISFYFDTYEIRFKKLTTEERITALSTLHPVLT